MPNLWLDHPMAPPREDMKPCWERLTKDNRRKFRAFVESDAAENRFKGVYDADIPRWQRMLHPERYAVRRPGHTGPRGPYDPYGGYLKSWPWMRDLPKRMWIGKGWMLLPEGLVKVTGGCGIPGAEIFEGVGTVKRTRDKKEVTSAAGQNPKESKKRCAPPSCI